MLGVSRCKMRHLQTILAGSTVCFGHNHRQPRTEIFNSRRRSNEGIKRGAIWDFMTGKSPWGNPQIPILLLNGQGEKTPFVESLPPCFSTESDCPPGTGVLRGRCDVTTLLTGQMWLMLLRCLEGSTLSNLVHRRRRCARIVPYMILLPGGQYARGLGFILVYRLAIDARTLEG